MLLTHSDVTQGTDLTIGRNLGFSVLLEDTLGRQQKTSGIKL